MRINDIMNLLTWVGVVLFLIVTILGIIVYLRDRRDWKDIQEKANQSEIRFIE